MVVLNGTWKGLRMNGIITRKCLALLAGIALLPCAAMAQGVAMVEDFESYNGNIGNWTISNSPNITVSNGLNLNQPIDGTRDLRQTLGVGLPGSSYTISNQSLNVPVPTAASQFRFKIRPLLALNLTRSVRLTLRGDNNITYVSPSVSLTDLSLNAVTDYSVNLATFTHPANNGVLGTLIGVSMRFETPILSVAAEESLDSLRFEWDNSSVPDWSTY